MGVRHRHFLLLFSALAGACAHRVSSPAVSNQLSQSKWDAQANLAIDDINPQPRLKPPTTLAQPLAPIDSLELYGRARGAILQGKPQAAIALLQQAIALDPYRYAPRYDLGWAYITANSTDENAIAAFEKAAQLEPDHLELQTELGRLYLAKADLPPAIEHLRLATLTSGYSIDDGQAAVVDFFLARALKESGYDRAALNQYTLLLKRFEEPSLSVQQNPELAYLLEKPDSLFIEIGELLEKHGEYADAVKAFKPAVEHSPDDFELQARYTRDLALAGDRDAAFARAVDLVVRDRATPPSLLVLRDVCRALNLNDGEVGALRKLSASRPGDQAVLYALTDTLIAKNRAAEAQQLLQSAWAKTPADIPLTRRLFMLQKQADDVDPAARTLIHALAVNPDALRNYAALWDQLRRAAQRNHLKISSLMAMQIPAGDESAKQFWIAQTAADEGRRSVQQAALQTAAMGRPVFAPAFRSLLAVDWARSDLDDAHRLEIANQLAQSSGDAVLQAELRGRSLLHQQKSMQAMAEFSHAVELGGRSPELILMRDNVSRGIGRDPQFEQRLWKLISDYPFYEDGYTTLFAYYANPDTASVEQAMKVLSTWLVSDPQSMTARQMQAQVDIQLGQPREAEAELSGLFADDPANPDVFRIMLLLYSQSGRSNELIGKLEEARVHQPRDTDIVARLVVLYTGQKRNAEATRLLDAERLIVADDADLLYSLANLYIQVDQKQTAEDVLQQAIALDPSNPGACNDLGFDWADQGKNLAQAESLIRIALKAEPDNESFLDSLGWVLYKRGKFELAQQYLQQAIAPSVLPDPVVLDHLGDTQYRLGKTDDARADWERSLKNMGDGEVDRAEMRQLRLQLLQKIKQAEAKRPVDVAPVVEMRTSNIEHRTSNIEVQNCASSLTARFDVGN